MIRAYSRDARVKIRRRRKGPLQPAVFSAYPYSHPDDMLESVRVNWSRAGATAESSGDYAEQVRRMASRLLLEQALRASGLDD